MKPYVFIFLADLHWGKTDADRYYEELTRAVCKPLRKLPMIDCIFIAGDYWDRILSMHHKAANRGTLFIQDLMQLCLDKNAKLRVVKGTQSHDNSMLTWFEISKRSLDRPLDMKIFDTVTSEQLYDDLQVLYLPEEYITSYEDHYGPYFKKDQYQLVVGHGLLDKASFQSKKQESEITHPNAPAIKVEDLMMINQGPSFFGHIHTRTTYKERVHYIGSISRYAHGEEEEKGFYILYYENPTDYRLEFIPNDYAPTYRTYQYTVDRMTNQEYLLEQIREEVDLSISNTRIKISVQEGVELEKRIIMTLQSQYGGKANRKLLIENHTKAQQERMKEEKSRLFMEEYGFLFDQREYYDKITTFIQKKKNRQLSPERVKQILYEKYFQ